MTKRHRIASFGAAASLVAAGVVSVVVIGGGTGQILALVLIGLGLVLATSLVFLEVGLSEDREYRRALERRPDNRGGRPRSARRPSIERSRGHRHRLR